MKKLLKIITKAILSVILAFVILIVFTGINIEVSEQLSYIWLVLSFGAWITIGLIRHKRKQKKPTSVNNTVQIRQPAALKPTEPEPTPVSTPDVIIETYNQNPVDQVDLVKQVKEKQPDILKKVDTRKDELAKLKEERLANCIYDLVVIDFETTGLNSNFLEGRMDEILSVAIIDQDGNTLLSTLCSTDDRKTWKKSEEIHGITPAMVKGKPTFSEILPEVKEILYKAKKVIAYNIAFEMGFLWSYDCINAFPGGTKIREMIDWGPDPMLMYCAYKGQLKWPKLSTVARHFKFSYKEHDALEDVKATLHVYKAMVQVAENENKYVILKYGMCYKKPGD